MDKIEIKCIGVMITIMILLNFAPPVLSHGVLCKVKCNTQCEFIGYTKKLFENCVKNCESHCNQLSNNPSYKCISNCYLTKSTTINNGARDLRNNEMNTCIQKCK
ncbi:uncharacterized protein HKW66_Vig0221070 [Vigna angularis]|uniref:Knottin scorpion toxin-like domain-containing protein n=1 Tax=Phaseolus angularis TaxID=3914 RepID=A0A8T0K0C9_PHAAN|nr:uncharacterized protein HKW66_Vig0221070 [Vigna angularis]